MYSCDKCEHRDDNNSWYCFACECEYGSGFEPVDDPIYYTPNRKIEFTPEQKEFISEMSDMW